MGIGPMELLICALVALVPVVTVAIVVVVIVSRKRGPAPTAVCPRCGAPLPSPAAVCPNCQVPPT